MSDEDRFLNTLIKWIEKTTHRHMRSFMRYIRGSELSISQANTLMRLYHHGPSPVNDLAGHLGISVAAVSQLLNPLIDLGYIVRSTNPSDRRIKVIALTELGTSTVEKSIQQRHAWVNDLADEFSPSEKAQLLPTLELLNNRILKLMEKNDPRCWHKNGKKHRRQGKFHNNENNDQI